MTSGQRTTVEEASRHEGELNHRQRRVLDLIVQGRTNPEIAADLGITLDGAKWHVSEILTKLGFSSREEAADYWRQRNRPGARLRRAFRALLGIPVVKVAIGTGVAGSVAGVAFAAWLLLAAGSAEGPAQRVPPFVLEARGTATYSSGSVLTTLASSPGSPVITDEMAITIRWWFRDPGHYRQEVQLERGLGSTTLVAAAAGANLILYDRSTNSVSQGVNRRLPDGYVVPPIPSVASMGPLPADSVAAFVNGWRRTGDYPKSAEIVGEEVILGRRTTIVDVGPTSSSTDSSGNETHGGTVRLWIDPERMFVMRLATGDSAGTSFRLDVTSLRYDLPARDVSVAFIPPPGATVQASANGSGFGSGSSGTSATLSGKPGFLLPSYIPPGYNPSSEGREGGLGGRTIAVEDILISQESLPSPCLRIQQRKRADGLPAVLRTGSPTRINGHDTYRGTNGSARTLAWEQDGISVLLTADALSYEELEHVATSMLLVP